MSAMKKQKTGHGVNVLMIGTGEYTTGYGQESAKSDKGAGVVGITMFDMRKRGKVARVGLCGVNGKKFPKIRDHMQRNIVEAYPTHGFDVTCDTFPSDDSVDPKAYEKALEAFSPGDAVTIFTPDDTHFTIALACVKRGLHVMVTKPPVKTLAEHAELAKAAKENNVLVMVEVHKRFDQIYVDAIDKIAGFGEFGFLNAYMSQPKRQLDTFRAWAGKSSDISYYLNSHHVDFHEWAAKGKSRPVRVTGTGSTGVATGKGIETEDTITLTVEWENLPSKNKGVALYTSSWVAPESDVHSQQRFHYMGHTGEVKVDQAHRGYSMSTDEKGYASVNPLFMKYTPTQGKFSGQLGYGYRSFEAFIDAVAQINAGEAKPTDFDATLATINVTFCTTAILEAGRMSLDNDSMPMNILYGAGEHPTGMEPAFKK